jgi:hypothetical protein
MTCVSSFTLDHSALTQEHIERATGITHTPQVVAEAYTVGLRTLLEFHNWCVFPSVKFRSDSVNSLTGLRRKDLALYLLFGRIRFLSQTLLSLTQVRHFQSIVAASRTAIELYVDMHLLAGDHVKNGVEKFFAFSRTQKLKAARRMVDFYNKNPTLRVRSLETYRTFIENNGAAIDAELALLWGPKASPRHWTNVNFEKRPEVLGVDIQELVHEGYDYRNWLLHSGAAGVYEMSNEALTALAATGVRTVHDVFLGAIELLTTELRICEDIEKFEDRLAELRLLPGFVMADIRLRQQGEPQRVFVSYPARPDTSNPES